MSKPNFGDWLVEAQTIVQEAGRILIDGLGRTRTVDFKGEVDLVTEIDRRSEVFVVGRLGDLWPDVSVLAEEGSGTQSSGPGLWILDPLDGTTNYAHGFPVFCVSLALEWEGELQLGIIHDPTRAETFTAVHGHGAMMNGRPLHVTGRTRVTESLLATGFPYDIRTSPRNNLARFESLALKARGIRRAGAAALDLAYVAAGRLDGYWEEKISAWDVAAGVLMVKEAAGRVTGYRGEPPEIRGGRIVATNGRIHAELLELLAAVEDD